MEEAIKVKKKDEFDTEMEIVRNAQKETRAALKERREMMVDGNLQA